MRRGAGGRACRLIIAIKWTTAFVDPLMACRTVIAFRNDSFLRISCGVRFALATATAFAPVSSAIRRRAEETAGADAPRSGIKPRAAVIQAIVLAVPMTAQVPA